MAYMSPSAALKAQAIIDSAARDPGRDPAADVVNPANGGRITSDGNQPATDDDQQIAGDAAHWTEVLTHLAVDIGFSSFILWTEPEPETLRIFSSLKKSRPPFGAMFPE